MIRINNLFKNYYIIDHSDGLIKRLFHPTKKEIIALKKININIGKGEIVGILGANGAGKSTLIKSMCGILTPSSGDILINGYVPNKREYNFLKQISVVMGNRSTLQYDLPIVDSLNYFKTIYNSENLEYEHMLQELTEKIGLKEYLNTPVRKLSLGQRRKAEILLSIVHNPAIIFLDEPTLGLDICSKKEILEFLLYLNKKYNSTIILTTHDLDDIEKICPRIIYLESGEVTYDGLTMEFQNLNNFKKVLIRYDAELMINESECIVKYYQNNNYEHVFIVQKDYLDEFLHKFDNQLIIELIITNLSLEEAVLIYESSHQSN